ncbi:hypothetical protein RHGRI_019056 [Rhododendron griersonianum]|uniref:Uncharacterized protein n=1 Tax=Rhododendron griersonianum TaxID=479676 RepID=A0AAV6JB02_9ERIC|nr:hypothetical protein RHGRI_019056 [Rhododendron griersonianum]
MAVWGKMEQMSATKEVSMTIAPIGAAVCAVRFATPSSPATRVFTFSLGMFRCCGYDFRL